MNYNTTPLPRILNAKDPITGRKLVRFSKRLGRYRPNLRIPKCRAGEEQFVENYDLAKNDNFKGWVLHHRLELTIDGEFANSTIDLVNKDMYFHRPYFELIWMEAGDHTSLHNLGGKNPMYGLDGISGTDHPMWKGDMATEHAKYLREYRAKKRSI